MVAYADHFRAPDYWCADRAGWEHSGGAFYLYAVLDSSQSSVLSLKFKVGFAYWLPFTVPGIIPNLMNFINQTYFLNLQSVFS